MKLISSTAISLFLFTATKGTEARILSSKDNAQKATKKDVLYTCISRYPGYSGPNDLSESKVTVTFFDGDDGEEMLFKYSLKGAKSGCEDCGIHIHAGTTCDDKDFVGGHYWDPGPDKTILDMWTPEEGAVYNTSPTATSTKGSFYIDNGYDAEGNDGHAVVVHLQSNDQYPLGERYGCGVLSTENEMCP